MAAYKQTSEWYEDGFGITVDVFIVADSYAGLIDLAAATEVGVFVIESNKEDLDLESGVFAADEISFTMSTAAIDTADDGAAMAFVLAAQDPAVRRYVGRLINPSDPPEVGDFAIRAVVRPEMSARDLQWKGAQYGSDPNPRREWKCSAGSYDVQEVLGADLAAVLDGGLLPDGSESPGIDTAWEDANVGDRVGYYSDSPTISGYPTPGLLEARWGNLVCLGVLLNKLLELASPAGFAITFSSSDTGLLAQPARFVPFPLSDGRVVRYTNRFSSPGYIAPYQLIDGDYYPMTTSNALGSIWISYRLLRPEGEGEEGLSWNRYGSLAELVYTVAMSIGCYAEFDYSDPTTATITFKSREDIVGDAIYLRDAVVANLDLKPLLVNDEERRVYAAASWEVSAEGPQVQYNYDGLGFRPSRQEDAAPTNGEMLPLSISPTWCLLENRGRDMYYNVGDVYGFSIIPHNAVFWQNGTRSVPLGAAETGRAVLHTGLYILTTGRADDGSVGVTGEDVWAPVARVRRNIDGEDEFFTRLADLTNRISGRDAVYFEGEYSITVPGLNAFRATPEGAGSWKHCKRGARIVLGPIEWVIVGIDRKRFETDIRLHASSRFAFDVSPDIGAAEIDGVPPPAAPSQLPRGNQVMTGVRGADIGKHVLVAIGGDKLLYPAEAMHNHYDKVIGITLAAGAEDEEAEIVHSGRVALDPALYSFSAGTRVYLRTPVGAATQNISSTPLSGSTATEDMHVPVGVMEPDNVLVLNIQPAVIYYPEIGV